MKTNAVFTGFLVSILFCSVVHSAPMTIDYTYDDLNRLKDEKRDGTNTIYNYDEVSNIVSQTVATSSATVNLAAQVISTTRIDLTWSVSTNNFQVAGYHIYRNGVQVGTTGTSPRTFSNTGLTPNTSYNFTVKAVDASGNLSAASNPVTAKTL